VTRDGLQRLRPGPERIEFRFSAPCLTAPERIRFRYQMSGVDPIWVEAGRDHSAIYASIPSGKHTFRVLASSPEGVWDSEPASIELAVHPYFWQTSWFWASVAALLAGGAVWIIRRATVRRLNLRLERLRQQQAVERERTRIAQDIHDELGANLTSIGLMADMGIRHRSDPEALTRELGQISATARESVAAMDAIVWTLNPRNDSLDHFANYVAQFTRDFFRPTRLRTRLDLPANLPAHPMTTDTRHQLFLIVKESFNNVVRHAEATEVNLQMACENGHLRLSIADNGQGIPGPTGGEGRDGLVNLEHRIKQLGGTLRIVTAKGEGVRLDFILPLAMLSSN
ncbi:MAG TPA: histidine kinase, partial [Verrucomicrobiae bacterium]|nr:histidine kinase [Verrucomicrobiae bacterium]